MAVTPRRRGVIATTLATLTAASLLAGATVATASTVPTPSLTAAMLGDDVLSQLPADAFEAGLDYAPQLVSVRTGTRALRDAVVASGLDVTEHAGDGFVEVVLYSDEDEAVLEALGLKWETVTPDLVALESQRILADAETFRTAAVDMPSGRTAYRNLADFGEEIDQLAADNPTLAKRISLGESVEGRDLTGIEIGVDVTDPEDGRPVMLMFGNHHAREWPSAETPMEFAHDLVNAFNAGDARTVDLLSRVRVVIVPVSNPDGFDASRTSGDLIDLNTIDGGDTVSILATPGNAYKRKNCRIVDGQTQPAGACVLFSSPGGNGIGVDLNRNYGALWGGPGAVGQTPDPDQSINGGGVLSAIYRGPAPFSEPETQAIRNLISTRQVTTLISNHTFSNLLLRPVGVIPTTDHPDGFPIGFAPDECFTTPSGADYGMQALGERMTAQTGYSNQFGWELYDTTGTTEDYSYNATGGYGYTFEIGPNQFHPPYEEVAAEYFGETTGAQDITPGNADDRTTGTARACEGTPVEHTTVGGGLREAYWIAVENAADPATHSVLTGVAPAGAVITATRSGTFPLWDGTPFEDTVTTSMTVPAAEGGVAAAAVTGVPFEYHVNPSTRPFVDSRAYLDPDAPEPVRVELSSESYTPFPEPVVGTEDIPIEVGPGVESILVDLTLTSPGDDYDLELYAPNATQIGSSGGLPGENEQIVFDRPGTGGIVQGTYVLRVLNYAAATPANVTVSLGSFPDYQPPSELETTRTTEEWTITCTFDGEELDSTTVVVDRGASADLGTLCAAGLVGPAPDPTGDPLADTGGGSALAAVFLLAAASGLVGLRRRRTT